MKPEIVLIAHNLRSCENVGSLLRTADGLGIKSVYLTGYTPYPKQNNDNRLPYLSLKIDKRIKKSSLGAENFVDWHHNDQIEPILVELKKKNFKIIALEQTSNAIELSKYKPNDNIAIIIGREVEGIEKDILKKADDVIFIPMFGKKESFNVTQAAAMAIYRFRFFN